MKKVFNITKDLNLKANNDIEITNKSKVTLSSMFRLIQKSIKNAENKEIIIKIEFIDKTKEFSSSNISSYDKKYLDKLEEENSKIKQILYITKQKAPHGSSINDKDWELMETYKKYLKDKIQRKIRDPSESSSFQEILIKYITSSLTDKMSNFEIDLYEICLIEIITEKFNFREFNNNIYFYLNDNLKKMKEINPNKDFRIIDNSKRQIEQYLMNLKTDIKDFYKIRNEQIKLFCENYETKNPNDEEEKDKKMFEELVTASIIASKIKGFNELDLNQFYILNENILVVCSALKANNSIRKLILTTNKPGIEGAYCLPKIFYFNPNFCHLDISSNGLDDFHMKIIANCLNKYSDRRINLRKLNISSNNNLTDVYSEYLAAIIEKSDNLSYLNISKTNIGKGFINILRSFENKLREGTFYLNELFAFSNSIDSDSIIKLGEILRYPQSVSLNTLGLSDNKLDNDAGHFLFESLKYNNGITNLLLFDCQIDDSFGEIIIDLIFSNKTLRKLGLYNNKFTDKTLKLVLKSLDGFETDPNDSEDRMIIDDKRSCITNLDLSKSNKNNDNLLKPDLEILNLIRSFSAKCRKLKKSLKIDISNFYKIDTHIEAELNSLNSHNYLVINY